MSCDSSNQPEGGFGNPPKRTRFKEKNCANPWGRRGKPKGPPAFDPAEINRRILADPVEITIGGKTRTVPAYEAILRRTAILAMGGNLKAIELLLKAGGGIHVPPAHDEVLIPERDGHLIANFLRSQNGLEPIDGEAGDE